MELSVPSVKLGKGETKIALVTGLHGNEHTGIPLFKQVASDLNNFLLNKCEIFMFPCANLSAYQRNVRNTPEDNQDLNRLFPGSADKTVSHLLANNIFNRLRGFDLVIDFHTFPKMDIPIIGVFFDTGDTNIKLTNLSFLYSLEPDYIWRLNTSSGEPEKSGSLSESLINTNTPSVAIETADIEYLSTADLKKISMKIVKSLNTFVKKDKTKTTSSKKIPIIERLAVNSESEGIFVSSLKPKEKIQINQIVGNIVSHLDLNSTPVISPHSGTIMSILHNTKVAKDQRVCIISKETNVEV